MDILLDKSHQQYQFFKEWLRSPIAGLELESGLKGFNATARNVFNKSIKQKYESVYITNEDRNNYLNDIHKVNISAGERQGREMHESYSHFPAEYGAINGFYYFACIKNNTLFAYSEVYILNEYAHISRILGHKTYLKDGIMVNLIAEIILFCKQKGCKVLSYSRITDGTDGLKYWKHSIGFKEIQINAI